MVIRLWDLPLQEAGNSGGLGHCLHMIEHLEEFKLNGETLTAKILINMDLSV